MPLLVPSFMFSSASSYQALDNTDKSGNTDKPGNSSNANNSADSTQSTQNTQRSSQTAYYRALPGLRPTLRVTQYLYDSWTEDNGLPQGVPAALAQTPDGYIWLGTVYGLLRFDGVRFTSFTDKTTPQLKVNDVKALTVDHTGALWIGTGGGGLLRYSNGVFTRHIADTSEFNTITALVADSRGLLWIGTSNGLLWADKECRFYNPVPALAGEEITALVEDFDRTLWAGTQNDVAHLTNLASLSTAALSTGGHSGFASGVIASAGSVGSAGAPTCIRIGAKGGLLQDGVRALVVDSRGNLWIGSNAGLTCRQRLTGALSTITTKQGLSSNAVTALYSDRQHTLWIGTNNGGLNRYNESSGSIAVITREHGLSGNTILSLLEDQEGSLWVGGGNGIDRIKDAKFTMWGKPEGFPNDIFSVVLQDSKGAFWSGSYFQSGINRFVVQRDGATELRHFDSVHGIAGAFVVSICEDRQGRLWFGTLGTGLIKYERGTFSTIVADGTENVIARSNIRAVFEDSRGRLWLGTWGGGLNILRDGKIVPAFTTEQGLSSDFVLGITEDSQGRLWIATTRGTSGAGVSILQIDSAQFIPANNPVNSSANKQRSTQDVKQLDKYLAKPIIQRVRYDSSGKGLPNKNAFCVVRDKEDRIWVGTATGAAIYHNNRFVTLSMQNGLPDETIFSILQDDQRNYWLLCSAGIMMIEHSQIAALLSGEITRVSARLYTKSDGLRSTEFRVVGQPMGCRAFDGTLWFPTVKGLAMINPMRLRTNVLAPAVVIEEVIANDKSIDLRDPAYRNESGMLLIPAGTERISFRYTALSLLFPEKVMFRHKLENFDADWITDREQRRAYDYTSLLPGRYVFRVQAANNDNVWNSEGIALAIYVEPKFYQTYPFYGLMLLLAAGAVAGIFRWRLRQLQDRERQLANLVNERTREIRRQVKILDEQAKEIELANTELQEKNQLLEEERMKSERLLLNVLPASIAERLKAGERIIADKFESVTVMFIDIVGFTNMSARVSPEHLVENLSMIFTTFDALSAKYKLEKIKTIGDAYMVVGGLPEPRSDHAEATAMMALELLANITDLMQNTEDGINIRVGIHLGAVVAGVIGVQKFAYDLWGDTVNTASRMESSGEPGKIHVSADVYEALKDKFEFEERGEIEVKGKGKMRTYFLTKIKTQNEQPTNGSTEASFPAAASSAAYLR